MPACDRPSALTASLTDDYVHIEVEPPEEPLPETDLKRQQHLKLLRQQAAEELERKLLEADERLSALKSALPSPQQEQQEQKLRQVFDSIIGQLQETFEGRQILEKPSIQKRRLLPDLSFLDQHQRAMMEQQRLLDALMVQVRHLINMDQVLFALEAQRLLLFHTFSGSCQTTREPALGAGAAATSTANSGWASHSAIRKCPREGVAFFCLFIRPHFFLLTNVLSACGSAE
jgi:hypothetical protein